MLNVRRFPPPSSRIYQLNLLHLAPFPRLSAPPHSSLPPNDNTKTEVEEQFNNNSRSMWQGINNITVFKGNKPATVNIAASLPDELNTFYARFEADNTAHTESAPTAAAEEVSPLSHSSLTTSHSTSTRPRSWWWISGDRAQNTHPSPSTRQL